MLSRSVLLLLRWGFSNSVCCLFCLEGAAPPVPQVFPDFQQGNKRADANKNPSLTWLIAHLMKHSRTVEWIGSLWRPIRTLWPPCSCICQVQDNTPTRLGVNFTLRDAIAAVTLILVPFHLESTTSFSRKLKSRCFSFCSSRSKVNYCSLLKNICFLLFCKIGCEHCKWVQVHHFKRLIIFQNISISECWMICWGKKNNNVDLQLYTLSF